MRAIETGLTAPYLYPASGPVAMAACEQVHFPLTYFIIS